MGRIADNVKFKMGTSWAALENDDRFGSASLTAQVEIAESRIFGDVLDNTEEEALHLTVVDFVSKVAMLEIIRSAIDFWMDQAQTVSTQGTQETVSYTDRINALKEQREEVLVDLARLEPIVGPMIPALQTRRNLGVPLLSSIDEELLTPNPRDLGRPYAEPAA